MCLLGSHLIEPVVLYVRDNPIQRAMLCIIFEYKQGRPYGYWVVMADGGRLDAAVDMSI